MDRESRLDNGGNDLFKQFFDLSLDMLVVAGLDGFYKKVNPAMVKTLGWTAEELLSRPWIEFVHPEDRQATESARDVLTAGKTVCHFENRYQGKDGSFHWLSWTSMPMPEQQLIFAVAREITGQKQVDEELQRHRTDLEQQVQERTALLRGINRIFREALFCDNEEQLGMVCLAVAEKLTGSKFGYLAEGDQTGKFETIAISNPGWSACEMPVSEALHFLKHMEVRGLRRRVLLSGETLIFNDPASHPDWIEPPKGHPAITSFLGVPLKHAGQTFGMIGLANREGGYHKHNQEDMEVLAVAVVEALTRKRAEWKLAQLRSHHELILSSASEGIMGLDVHCKITFVNPSAAQMLGYQAVELIGRNAHALCHHSKPDGTFYPPEECPLQETLRGVGVPFEDDWFWRKDGTGFPVRCSRSPIIHNGRISGIVVTFRDITARKEMEETLRQSEETHRRIVETALEGIWTIDPDNKVTYANERLAAMLGYHRDELLGAPIAKFLDQESLEQVTTGITESLRKGFKEQADLKFRRQDGTELWAIVTASPIFDPPDRYAGALGMVTDITARKEAEEGLRSTKAALEEQERFLASIFESIQDGISILDPGLNVIMVNRAKERDHAHAMPLVGKRCYEVFHEAKKPCANCPARRTLRTGKAEQAVITTRLSGKEGLRHLNLLTFPLINHASGAVNGVVEYARDITEQVQAEAEIARLASFPELNPNPVLEVDPQGKITYANPAAHQAAGKLGLRDLQAFLPADMEAILGCIRERKEDQFWRENRLGERIFSVYVYAVPQFRVARFFFADTTEQKQAEAELRQSEERFRHISSTISDISYSCSRSGSSPGDGVFAIDWMVGAAERITGYSLEEIMARGCWGFLVVEEDLPLLEEHVLGLPAGANGRCELRFRHKNGKIVWVDSFAEVIEKQEQPQRLRLYGGLVDITARKEAEAAIKESLEKLHLTVQKTVKALSSTIEIRDPYTAGHQRRVTQLAQAIARELGLSKDQLDALCIAGTIHDLGKIYVPAEILSRPGRLSDSEFSLVKDHSLKGFEILDPIQFPWPVAQIVRQHHERLNGSGYPDGLRHEEILLEARILAVADVVEAIASHRPYRPALGIDAAMEEISRNRGILFDQDVVDACIKVFKEKGFAFD